MRYLQGKTVDVISARIANRTIQTLRTFQQRVANSISSGSEKIKKRLRNSQFELCEARTPRNKILRRIQALLGEHTQREMRLTSESHYRVNTYHASLDKVLSELEVRFSGNNREYSVFWEISLTGKRLIKKLSFFRTAKFYEIDGEILVDKSRKCSRVFVASAFGFHSTTVSEILQTMQEKGLFDSLPEFSNVVHVLVVIPAT